LVMHLDDLNDATSNGYTGTAYSASDTTAGLVGGAYAFYGDSGNRIEVGSVVANADSISLMAFARQAEDVAQYQDYVMSINSTPDVRFYIDDGAGIVKRVSIEMVTSTANVTGDGIFHMYFFSQYSDVTDASFGMFDTNDGAQLPNIAAVGTGTVSLGNYRSSDNTNNIFSGVIDEFRLANRWMSQDFGKTIFRNIKYPSSFASEGVAE